MNTRIATAATDPIAAARPVPAAQLVPLARPVPAALRRRAIAGSRLAIRTILRRGEAAAAARRTVAALTLSAALAAPAVPAAAEVSLSWQTSVTVTAGDQRPASWPLLPLAMIARADLDLTLIGLAPAAFSEAAPPIDPAPTPAPSGSATALDSAPRPTPSRSGSALDPAPTPAPLGSASALESAPTPAPSGSASALEIPAVVSTDPDSGPDTPTPRGRPIPSPDAPSVHATAAISPSCLRAAYLAGKDRHMLAHLRPAEDAIGVLVRHPHDACGALVDYLSKTRA